MTDVTNPVHLETRQDRTSSQSAEKKSPSMHDDIPVWYDCCSCEAEPYWLEAMAQSGLEVEKQTTR